MPTTDQAIAITLPSLIHRIGSDTVKRLKLQAQTFDCELKRIRRSRNWQLLGEAASMQKFVIQIKQTEYQVAEYLIRRVESRFKAAERQDRTHRSPAAAFSSAKSVHNLSGTHGSYTLQLDAGASGSFC